ncbi:alpha/beta hydrolase family protein [Motilibacter aurantiacus]|uniref:alpha/beta hydrolase family protein n=1 Tax=Motilibacter aurantiacus TaxID=2714955 RepID=UPI0014083816|nr:alpha/beta fold hydrolase [Motilibacter aurantiacus]NHC46251.1 alpha/beta fold hydrolase [Motilibacter aurantiacus]
MDVRRTPALLLALATALAGCTSSDADTAGGEAPVDRAAPSAPVTPVTPEAAPSPSASPTPSRSGSATPTPSRTAKPDPVSLPAMFEKEYDGRGLKVGRTLDRNSAYTRHYVTYRSGKLTISGILNVPRGKGPFPALVLAHGHIDTDIYVNGQGLRREQDYLAREGYVVLHTDYRNHAQSSDDPDNEVTMRLGYTEDVVNAVLALRRSGLGAVDKERIGLLGRSMGGGIALNTLVAQPGLVDAAVVFASVSSSTIDNFNRWTRDDEQLAGEILDRYGTPKESPAFWRGVSPRTYFDRVTEPVLIHHGTSDSTCPIEWSRTTRDALERRDKDVTMYEYQGEEHAFGPQWPTSMRRTVAFFDRHLAA